VHYVMLFIYASLFVFSLKVLPPIIVPEGFYTKLISNFNNILILIIILILKSDLDVIDSVCVPGVGCFSFFFWLRVLDKAEYSAFQSTLNSPIVSYIQSCCRYDEWTKTVMFIWPTGSITV